MDKRAFQIVLLLMIVILLQSCSKEQTPRYEIVGTWVYQKESFFVKNWLDKDTHGLITFNEDGTGMYDSSSTTDFTANYNFIWRLDYPYTLIYINKVDVNYDGPVGITGKPTVKRTNEDNYVLNETELDSEGEVESFENWLLTKKN